MNLFNDLKNNKMELFFLFIISVVLMFLLDFIPDLVGFKPSKAELFSPLVLGLSLIVFLLPLILGFIGCFLLKNKNLDLKSQLILISLIVAFAGILLVSYSLVSFSLLDSNSLMLEFNKAKQAVSDYGINLFENMSLTEFKSFMIDSMALGLVLKGFMDFAFALVGGLIGFNFFKKKSI